MAFCPSCGKQLSEEESKSAFCAYCGKPLEGADNNTYGQPAGGNDLQNQATALVEKVKGLDKKILIGVPVALVVIIIAFMLLGGGSQMSPVNDYIKLINKQEIDSHKLEYALTPDFRANLLKNVHKQTAEMDRYEDMVEDRSEYFEDIYDEINDEYDKWKIGFEVKEKEKLSKKKLEDIQENWDDYFDDYIEDSLDHYDDCLKDDDDLEDFADSMDIDEKEAEKLIKAAKKYAESFEDVKIQEAYEVKGKFTIKADKDEWESETVKLILVKINGDWAYAGLDDGDSIVFDDDDEELDLFRPLFSALSRGYLGQGTAY